MSEITEEELDQLINKINAREEKDFSVGRNRKSDRSGWRSPNPPTHAATTRAKRLLQNMVRRRRHTRKYQQKSNTARGYTHSKRRRKSRRRRRSRHRRPRHHRLKRRTRHRSY
jgi:hypothetical protein